MILDPIIIRRKSDGTPTIVAHGWMIYEMACGTHQTRSINFSKCDLKTMET
jgi:hypothetical protein